MPNNYQLSNAGKSYRGANGKKYNSQDLATITLRRILTDGSSTKKLPGLNREERLQLQNAMSRAQDFYGCGKGYYLAFLEGCKLVGLEPLKVEAYFAGTSEQEIMAGVTRLFSIYGGRYDTKTGRRWTGFLTLADRLVSRTQPQKKKVLKKPDKGIDGLPLFQQAQEQRPVPTSVTTLEDDLTEEEIFAPTFPRWPANSYA